MLLVDTSVVIDNLRDLRTRQTAELDERIGSETVVLGDLVLMEVLQGTRDDAHEKRVAMRLKMFEWRDLVDEPVAVEAARHFRTLRAVGVSLRSQIDLLIGTFCISHDHELLHADRDYDQMVRHLGLRVAAASRPPH